MSFSDHFSGVAPEYARFRPDYPDELFDWLAGTAPQTTAVWDCACGSGQAALPLAARFDRVFAVDASLAQLQELPPLENVVRAAAVAEIAPLADCSVDLVTVGQAVHWFDQSAFFGEAQRVLAPGGLVAVWTYGVPAVDHSNIVAIIRRFIEDDVGAFWPPEIAQVLDGYASIQFPFTEIKPPRFEMEANWTLERFLGLVRTWSGVVRYLEARGEDPVETLAVELAREWGGRERRRTIRWQLEMRAGFA